jgi:hypothetical protein
MVVGQDDLTRQQEPTALFELGVNGSGNPEGPDNHKVSERKVPFCSFSHGFLRMRTGFVWSSITKNSLISFSSWKECNSNWMV